MLNCKDFYFFSTPPAETLIMVEKTEVSEQLFIIALKIPQQKI